MYTLTVLKQNIASFRQCETICYMCLSTLLTKGPHV